MANFPGRAAVIGFLLMVCLMAVTSVNAAANRRMQYGPTQAASIALAIQVPCASRDTLPRINGRVNDFEKIFDASEVSALDSMIADIENKAAVKIVLVSMDSTMTTRDGVDELTRKIKDLLAADPAINNTELVIGISKIFRRMRIEYGSGLATRLTDQSTKEIIDQAFIPAFREGKYYEGTINGLRALLAKLSAGAQ